MSPELGVIWLPGSGKLGTLCERMQLANASPGEPGAFLLAVGLSDDPHAATQSPQLRMLRIRAATSACVQHAA